MFYYYTLIANIQGIASSKLHGVRYSNFCSSKFFTLVRMVWYTKINTMEAKPNPKAMVLS